MLRLVPGVKKGYLDSAPKARYQNSPGAFRTYRAAVTDLSPGLQPICANLIVIAGRLIVPEGRGRQTAIKLTLLGKAPGRCCFPIGGGRAHCAS